VVLGRDEVGNSTLTANRGDHPSSTFIGGGKSTTKSAGNYTTSGDANLLARSKPWERLKACLFIGGRRTPRHRTAPPNSIRTAAQCGGS